MAAYGISAVRYSNGQIGELWMGLLEQQGVLRWVARPSPLRLSAVIDRILGGDSVAAVIEQQTGELVAGPAAQIAMQSEFDETLAFPSNATGPTIEDLPHVA